MAFLELTTSFLSNRTEPISRISEFSFGKIPMTEERRFSSLFSRSIWFDVLKYLRKFLGSAMTVMALSKPSSRHDMADSATSL